MTVNTQLYVTIVSLLANWLEIISGGIIEI
jgi:hypothetical protein